MTDNTRIILGGDVMLGRIVKGMIATEGLNYPMGKIEKLMQQGHLTIVNLECAITSHQQLWHGAHKAFYFGAPPEAAQILKNCGTRIVSLANNHILDYDIDGLSDTLKYLELNTISHTGAGMNISEALLPAYYEANHIKIGMVAFCDHQRDFSATINSPGMAHLNLSNPKAAIEQLQSSLDAMLKAGVDYPILSLHWGPNMVLTPSQEFRHIAHAAIDMGYKLLYGHSAHVFQGIEIYRGCPIIYAAGDLVDDYYVDPEFQNDHQLIFEIEITPEGLQDIKLYPVYIDYCQTKPANQNQFKFIEKRMTELCSPFGTSIRRQNDGYLLIMPK